MNHPDSSLETSRIGAFGGVVVVIWALLSSPAACQEADLGPVVLRASDDDDGPVVVNSGVGYIDSAVLADQLRIRFDSAYGIRQPARGEWFWPVGPPQGPGPGAETNIDSIEASAYLEWMVNDRFSVFGEMPFRILNPTIQDNTAGLGDVSAGFKYAIGCSCDSLTTFQLRAFAPSADEDRGLGTGHATLEPALLFRRQLTCRTILEGELRDWISIGGTTDFEGNILRYGLGISHQLNQPCCDYPVFAVFEFVGWTVLDGSTAITTNPPLVTRVEDATGDTIVNIKAGLRWRLARRTELFAGYGHALTGDRWYDDIFRIELRSFF